MTIVLSESTHQTPLDDTSSSVLFTLNAEGLAKVTLNSPEKHNAFDDKVITKLTAIFTEISQRNDIRIMLLDANGKSFSAGADLAWMKRMVKYSYEENLRDAQGLALMLKTLNFMPQTTIAKVQGAAFGGAVGLVSCCDIAFASDEANFCLSEVKLGLIPATISPYVVNAMGEKNCRRYFQSAEQFSATKALELGLVSEVFSSNELNKGINSLITKLLKNGPEAVKQAKQLAIDVHNKSINDELVNYTSQQIARIRVSTQGQEGLSAFFDKRPPEWVKNTDGKED